MSKEQKFTRWFPVRIKPVRVGLYEVRYPERPKDSEFRYWDGSEWIKRKGGSATLFGVFANDKWRGLAKEPK